MVVDALYAAYGKYQFLLWGYFFPPAILLLIVIYLMMLQTNSIIDRKQFCYTIIFTVKT